jgi:hypothetical protein
MTGETVIITHYNDPVGGNEGDPVVRVRPAVLNVFERGGTFVLVGSCARSLASGHARPR